MYRILETRTNEMQQQQIANTTLKLRGLFHLIRLIVPIAVFLEWS